jgi:hypothetical protein
VVVRRDKFGARVNRAAFAVQPLAVQKVCARQVDTHLDASIQAACLRKRPWLYLIGVALDNCAVLPTASVATTLIFSVRVFAVREKPLTEAVGLPFGVTAVTARIAEPGSCGLQAGLLESLAVA